MVVTRPAAQADGLVGALDRLGAEVIRLPVIAIADPESWDELDRAVTMAAAGRYDWILVSSANGARALAARMRACGLTPGSLGARIGAVGDATAAALAAAGLVPDLVPDRSDGAALAEALGRGTGRVLLPRPQGSPAGVLERLRTLGWTPEEVVAYVNRPVGAHTPEAEAVRAGRFDAVTFASGSAVRAFAAAVASPGAASLSPADDGARTVACIGPVTARAARALGYRVDAVASEQTDVALAAAVADAARRTAGRPA